MQIKLKTLTDIIKIKLLDNAIIETTLFSNVMNVYVKVNGKYYQLEIKELDANAYLDADKIKQIKEQESENK